MPFSPDRAHPAPGHASGALLEFQSPSAALLALPVPRGARGVVWIVAALFGLWLLETALIPVDRVVTAPGRVVAVLPTLVVQPLETAIVRSIDVSEGQGVHAGDLLARLDPTFAAADAAGLAAQLAALKAETDRLRAEAEETPFSYSGSDPNLSLQAAIDAERRAERKFKLETYRARISGLEAALAKNEADARSYRARKAVAEAVEAMRQRLQRLQVGSRLNALAATDNRLEMERGLSNALESIEAARRDLEALKAERDAYDQNWRGEVSQKLSERTQKLAEVQEQLNKAALRHHLVELRADRDATVLTVAKVSPGSVLQSGDQLITLIPAGAPLEVEADIAGQDDGFVHIGAPAAIKFRTFPFIQYGMARGRVRTVSADSFTAPEDERGRPNHGAGHGGGHGGRQEPFYRSRITIDEVGLHDVPPGFHILPGMPVSADILVGKRTLLGYFLGRVLPVASEGMREP